MSSTASRPAESSLPQMSSETFRALKAICVPLLSNSLLKLETIPRASTLLSQLSSLLEVIEERESTISPASIEYVFFPISQIFQRNPISVIPDIVMEPLMGVLCVLFRQWWWSCQTDIWEQVLMLSAAIFCGIGTNTDPKGKRKDRDEETKRATAQCLWAILRRRHELDLDLTFPSERTASKAEERFALIQVRARSPKILPILGQTLTSLLETSQSANRELQNVSLDLVYALIVDYFPETFIPSILPGVVSAMAKVALGRSESKGWSRGDIVDKSLSIMQTTILSAIRDDICEAEGALRNVTSLEDLNDAFEVDGKPRPVDPTLPTLASPFFTPRTSVWLGATASQLHIALNTLSPLLSHTNPVALLALSRFSHGILTSTTRSLPDSQPLLLSYLLSLSTNQLTEVTDASHARLLSLLVPPCPSRFALTQVLLRLMRDNLTSLPRLIPSQSDARVEHIARQISAACELSEAIPAVSDGVRKLLGPTGGIEKWGWNLLSVLEFTVPPLFVSTAQPAHALLGTSPDNSMDHSFPEVNMKFVSSRSAREALESMFRALGSAAGTDSLFTVEWFMNVARRGKHVSEVAALWCAGRILEGLSDVSLDDTKTLTQTVPTRVEKVARWATKVISELWDQDEQEELRPAENRSVDTPESDNHLPLEYVKGLNPLITRFDLVNHERPTQSTTYSQDILHKVLSLQLFCITSAILRSRFMRALLHTLYPILHSIVSQDAYISTTALAALYYITAATGYASPSNLLLANFDYALDGVARRLDRRHLDPEATKVLVVLVRLVGKDIVLRAGDVVEACFDRLDEFHGYEALVDGLIEVLSEVVEAVATVDDASNRSSGTDRPASKASEDHIQSFIEWYQHRNDVIEEEQENYGPAPRQGWADLAGKGKEKAVDGNDIAENPNLDSEVTPAPNPTQVLTQQIVSHSIYFLTHSSPIIRTRILGLLDTASPTLSDSSLLPSIHRAWPYILNRLEDSEPFVVSAAASLIASLAEHVGEFMASRIWDGVWPRFRTMLSKLEEVDSHSALSRRGYGAVGTESAYSHSHRLYKSLLRTMRAVVKGAQLRHDVLWELVTTFRRFLHKEAHMELQHCARDLYVSLMEENGDVVWLALSATISKDVTGESSPDMAPVDYLREGKWDIEENVRFIFGIS